MLDPNQIETWIAGLPCDHILSVEGDGHHFAALIVSGEFRGSIASSASSSQCDPQNVSTRCGRNCTRCRCKTLTPEEWKANG
jgi:acid stress-induced BolA-like protein IbaG/YrbA